MQSKTKHFNQIPWLILSCSGLMNLGGVLAAPKPGRDPFSPGIAVGKLAPVRPKFILVSTTVACEASTDIPCYDHTAIIQHGTQFHAVRQGETYAGWRVAEITATTVRLTKLSDPASLQILTLKDQNYDT